MTDQKHLEQLGQIQDDALVETLYYKIVDRFGENGEYESIVLAELPEPQASLYYVNAFQINFLWDGLSLSFKNLRKEMPHVISGLKFFKADGAIKVLNAAGFHRNSPPAFLSDIAKKYQDKCGVFVQGQDLEDWYYCLYEVVSFDEVTRVLVDYIRKNPEEYASLLKTPS